MAAGGVALVLTGRGGDETPKRAPAPVATTDSGKTMPRAGSKSESDSGQKPDQPQAKRPKILPESSCPPDAGNCVATSGRVIYVEKVDPDGDGDAHFVTVSASSVTGPGITIFDVRADLRPDPLPGIGDLVGGAGPVYPGHAGQKQIQVTEFHVAE